MEEQILEWREVARGRKTTILHIAVRYGTSEDVEYILREFAENNYLVQLDSDKQTALHVAADACFKDDAKVKVLIDAARNLGSTSSDDRNQNLITCFQDFIRHPNNWKNTALHLAASNGNMVCAEMLVQADPRDRHIKNCDGATPLYLAADLGHLDIVKVICRHCTSLTFDGPQGTTTALHTVIKKLRTAADGEVVLALIDAAKRSFSFSLDRQGFLRQPDSNMDTALHLAVKGNHLDMVDLILKEDPTYIYVKNIDSKTPIYIAAEEGYTDVVKRLCETGFTDICKPCGPNNGTALHAAIKRRNRDCVKALLNREPKFISSLDGEGLAPLHYAACFKFDHVLDDIIQTEISHGIWAGNKGKALYIAARQGHISTVIQLLISLPPPNCADVYYKNLNVLHVAASMNNKEMVKCILKYCPPEHTAKLINQKDDNGDTPLHLLIKSGCFVPQLINHKDVNPRAANKENWTALEMLYFDEDIIADQLPIKILVDVQAKQKRNFWNSRLRRTRGNLGTQQIVLLSPSRKSRKDAQFLIEQRKLMKKELNFHKESVFARMIVTVLITTVTFTVGFTLPGGYHQSGEPDEGLAVFSKKAAFNVFMVADTIALVLSAFSLFIFFILRKFHDPVKVSQLRAISSSFNIASLIAMMLTFMMGTYVVLAHSPVLAITVCIITSFFFILVFILCFQMIMSSREEAQLGVYIGEDVDTLISSIV